MPEEINSGKAARVRRVGLLRVLLPYVLVAVRGMCVDPSTSSSSGSTRSSAPSTSSWCATSGSSDPSRSRSRRVVEALVLLVVVVATAVLRAVAALVRAWSWILVAGCSAVAACFVSIATCVGEKKARARWGKKQGRGKAKGKRERQEHGCGKSHTRYVETSAAGWPGNYLVYLYIYYI